DAARDLGSVEVAVEPVGRPVAAGDQRLGVNRSAVEVGDLDRVCAVGEVEHRHAALIPRLRHDVAPRYRDEGTVGRDAVLRLGLRRRHLEVAGELQRLAVDDVEDGVGAPAGRIAGAAARTAPGAPPRGREYL